MNTRVKEIRKTLKLSQEAFGAKLGITGAGLSKIDSGHRSLTESMLLYICKEFQINERWLRSGEGEMFRQLPDGMKQLADNYRLDELDSRIIYEYISLDETSRKVIKEYIRRITQINLNKLPFSDSKPEVPYCAEGPSHTASESGLQYGTRKEGPN